MHTILNFILKPLAVLSIILIGMFIGSCFPCYIALKGTKKENIKLMDVINMSMFVIYKVIIKGEKL